MQRNNLSEREAEIVEAVSAGLATLRVFDHELAVEAVELRQIVLLRDAFGIGVERGVGGNLIEPCRPQGGERARYRIRAGIPTRLDWMLQLQAIGRAVFAKEASRACADTLALRILIPQAERHGAADPQTIEAASDLVMMEPAPLWFTRHLPGLLMLAERVRVVEPASAGRYLAVGLGAGAVAAGKRARLSDEHENAEEWLRRGAAVAAVEGDRIARATAFLNYGILVKRRHGIPGHPLARRYMRAALREASAAGCSELQGQAYHDLSSLEMEEGNPAEACRYARLAFRSYERGSTRAIRLVSDIGYLWIECGWIRHGLDVLIAALPHITESDIRILALGNIVRAAAEMGRFDLYAEHWQEVWEGVGAISAWDAASSLVHLAEGAVAKGDYRLAKEAACRSLVMSRINKLESTRTEARKWLRIARERGQLALLKLTAPDSVVEFAEEIVRSFAAPIDA